MRKAVASVCLQARKAIERARATAAAAKNKGGSSKSVVAPSASAALQCASVCEVVLDRIEACDFDVFAAHMHSPRAFPFESLRIGWRLFLNRVLGRF